MWRGQEGGHATKVGQFHVSSAGGAVSKPGLPSSHLQVSELEKLSRWAICTVLLGNMVVVGIVCIVSLDQVLVWD